MNKKASFLQVNILILGGGLTGLSAAYHLEQQGCTDYLLVEKNPFFGGLAASRQIDGFTFDCSGHLLHLRDPYALTLVKKLLRGNLIKHTRQAFIDFDGQRVPFPFQANLWALAKPIAAECLAGAQAAAKQPAKTPKNFEQWCLQSFGAGIYKHFLKPYNTKLWQIPPDKMTPDWCSELIARPDTKQIAAGAKRQLKKQFGYNTTFYYPRCGGCGALAEAFAAQIPNTWLNAQVQQIDLKKKCAQINGQTVYFKQLLNTLPLPAFIHLCKQVPRTVGQAANALKALPIHVLQLAVAQPTKPFHWIYFPQPNVPFFRVGMQSSFSPQNAPQNASSFYIETTQKITDFKKAQKAFLKVLVQKGIIEKRAKILGAFWQTISPAYARYDFKHSAARQRVLHWLSGKNCLCAGRYGLWEYSFMERSILQGREAATQFIQGK